MFQPTKQRDRNLVSVDSLFFQFHPAILILHSSLSHRNRQSLSTVSSFEVYSNSSQSSEMLMANSSHTNLNVSNIFYATSNDSCSNAFIFSSLSFDCSLNGLSFFISITFLASNMSAISFPPSQDFCILKIISFKV